MEPIFDVICNEPEGPVTRTVYKLSLDYETLYRFWLNANKYATLFGEELHSDPKTFLNMFFTFHPDGRVESNSMFYVIDDFVGMFRLCDYEPNGDDVMVHYTFFDRRHKGRVELMRRMIRYIFDELKFTRVSAELPAYVKSHIAKFLTETVGFVYEGKKRHAVTYNGKKFHINLYGLTVEDIAQWDSSNHKQRQLVAEPL